MNHYHWHILGGTNSNLNTPITVILMSNNDAFYVVTQCVLRSVDTTNRTNDYRLHKRHHKPSPALANHRFRHPYQDVGVEISQNVIITARHHRQMMKSSNAHHNDTQEFCTELHIIVSLIYFRCVHLYLKWILVFVTQYFII